MIFCIKLTLDILEFMMDKKKSKVIFMVFLNNLFGGGHSFFNFFKGGLLPKFWEILI